MNEKISFLILKENLLFFHLLEWNQTKICLVRFYWLQKEILNLILNVFYKVSILENEFQNDDDSDFFYFNNANIFLKY